MVKTERYWNTTDSFDLSIKFFAFKEPKSKKELHLMRNYSTKLLFQVNFCLEIGLGPQYYIPPAKSNNESTYSLYGTCPYDCYGQV